jgi:DUF1009 family protein
MKFGLVAGNGELPVLLAKSILAQGHDLACVAVTDEAYNNLKSLIKTYRLAPVEIYRMLELAHREQVQEITFLGKVPKLEFFKSLHKMDLPLLQRMYKELKNFSDDSLHNAISKFVEEENGLRIADQTKFLRALFPDEQVFSKRKPDDRELQTIRYGMSIAKQIAALDIGQTVVVQNSSVLAVEAIEGTNECIKRARSMFNLWSRNRNIVICKVSKPNQDQRFDVPTIGLQTLKSAGKNSIIAFEAKETFFINQNESISYADAHNICLLALPA